MQKMESCADSSALLEFNGSLPLHCESLDVWQDVQTALSLPLVQDLPMHPQVDTNRHGWFKTLCRIASHLLPWILPSTPSNSVNSFDSIDQEPLRTDASLAGEVPAQLSEYISKRTVFVNEALMWRRTISIKLDYDVEKPVLAWANALYTAMTISSSSLNNNNENVIRKNVWLLAYKVHLQESLARYIQDVLFAFAAHHNVTLTLTTTDEMLEKVMLELELGSRVVDAMKNALVYLRGAMSRGSKQDLDLTRTRFEQLKKHNFPSILLNKAKDFDGDLLGFLEDVLFFDLLANRYFQSFKTLQADPVVKEEVIEMKEKLDAMMDQYVIVTRRSIHRSFPGKIPGGTSDQATKCIEYQITPLQNKFIKIDLLLSHLKHYRVSFDEKMKLEEEHCGNKDIVFRGETMKFIMEVACPLFEELKCILHAIKQEFISSTDMHAEVIENQLLSLIYRPFLDDFLELVNMFCIHMEMTLIHLLMRFDIVLSIAGNDAMVENLLRMSNEIPMLDKNQDMHNLCTTISPVVEKYHAWFHRPQVESNASLDALVFAYYQVDESNLIANEQANLPWCDYGIFEFPKFRQALLKEMGSVSSEYHSRNQKMSIFCQQEK